jgi:hypothetical protein
LKLFHVQICADVLPLVEFLLEDGISDDEAIQLLLSSNDIYERRTSADDTDAAFQTLLIEDTSQTPADLFTSTLVNLEVRIIPRMYVLRK